MLEENKMNNPFGDDAMDLGRLYLSKNKDCRSIV